MGRVIKHSYCRELAYKINETTEHIVSIEEYPERPSDLTIDGRIYKRMSNTKIYEILNNILEENTK